MRAATPGLAQIPIAAPAAYEHRQLSQGARLIRVHVSVGDHVVYVDDDDPPLTLSSAEWAVVVDQRMRQLEPLTRSEVLALIGRSS